MCRGGTGASARTTTTYFQLLPPSCYYYYLLPTTYYFFRERALALSPRSTFKPLGGVEVERFFSEGGTPPIFWPRGAAAVLLSFF